MSKPILFRRRALSSLAAATLVGLAACATKNPMKATDLAVIKTVYVRPEVTLAPDMFFISRGSIIAGALAGPVGAVVAGASGTPPTSKEVLEASSRSPGVNVRQIVLQSFIKEANERTRIKFTSDASASATADAELTLEVNRWGMYYANALFDQLHPVFGLKATMKRRDGALVWEHNEGITALNELNKQGYALDDLLTKPEVLKTAYQQGASIIAKYFIDALLP